MKGVPRLRFHDKDNRLEKAFGMGASVKELRVVRTPLRTELHVVLKHPDREMPVRPIADPVGIDKGIKHRMTLSDGARNADFRFAHWLVSTYDAIFVEKLNIAGLARSKRFSKKLHEQRWGTNDQIVEHKAGKAGVPFVMVNPAYTSTDCSSCGHRQPMPLEVRVYECPQCGLVMCRGCSSAVNISVRAFGRMAGSGGIPRCRRSIQDVDIRPCSLPRGSGNHTPQNSIEQQAA